MEKISDLVDIYCRLYLRGEDLDMLSKVQDIYFSITDDELEGLARKYLDLSKAQIFMVADGDIPIPKKGGTTTLYNVLRGFSFKLGMKFIDIPLR